MISIDLDDAWAYRRARNLSFDDTPSIISLATRRFLGLFDAAGIDQATVFVVGADAQRVPGRRAIGDYQAAGCEIADHSFMHRGELAGLGMTEICDDLDRSRDAIAQVTGRRPTGFRCPSFGASPALDAALRDAGDAYDASALPTPLMPALRAYHRLTAGKGEHEPSYGNLRTAFGSLRPHLQTASGSPLLAIPTTTLPLARTPFHGSYLMALAARAPRLAAAYAHLADRACRAFGLPVSFLLHPTDVLDDVDAPQLAFFPGMSVPATEKRRLLLEVLRRLAHGRDVVSLDQLQGSYR